MSKERNRYHGADMVVDPEGNWVSPDLPFIDTGAQRDDKLHTVVEGDRLDGLAQRYLGNARLWWVIAEYNDIAWMLDIQVGQTLRIPSFEHASLDLLR